MPFINGKYYMNPAYGRALESVAGDESGATAAGGQNGEAGHWVTIDHHHVLIRRPHGQQSKHPRKIKIFRGDATYYNLPGSKTASGQRFDPNTMTAAMTAEKVRLGQTVVVTYTTKDKKGNTITRSVPIVVNDRGPFARNADGSPMRPLQPDPRGVIDLTPAAFKKLTGSLDSGRVHVSVAVPDE